jgi:hypothetical protein
MVLKKQLIGLSLRTLRLGEKSAFAFSCTAVIRPHLGTLDVAGNKIQSARMLCGSA